jgi:hypothetical protein
VSWIDRQFSAAAGRYRITSAADDDYNCIAYAAGDTKNWWSHEAGYKWPVHRSPLIDSLVTVFTSLGYAVCASDALEPGFEKVALYAKGGTWSHAALQLPSGKWSSKLGPDEDIEHDTSDCLAGSSYGTVHCIMRRRTP